MAGTVPVIPAFAGYPQASDFNGWVQAPFTFLTSKVMLRAQLQAAQAIPAATFTLAQFGSTGGDILEDPYSGWSTVATGSQPAWSWLCPAGCTGWYEITMTSFTTNPGNAISQIQAVLYLNGVIYSQMSAGWGMNGGHNTGSGGSAPVALTGGSDYIQGYIFSTAAVTAAATAGQYPTFEACWVST